MMLYEYVCTVCDARWEIPWFTRIGEPLVDMNGMTVFCPEHSMPLIRCVSNPQVRPADPEPYFNYSVGDYVKSNKDFEEKLRIGAEQQSERLGIEHRYAPVYPSESRAMFSKVASNDGSHGESVERLQRLAR